MMPLQMRRSMVVKLRMDFLETTGLCGARKGRAMDEEEADALISRMFALLTMKFEDGAEKAARGQKRRDADTLHEMANDVLTLAEEATTVAMATAALLARAR